MKQRLAMVRIPLSEIRCLSRHPKKKTIVCEISVEELQRYNTARTLDDIINDARLDYARGNYKTFTTAKTLLCDLHA